MILKFNGVTAVQLAALAKLADGGIVFSEKGDRDDSNKHPQLRREKVHKTVRVMNITKVISRPAVDDKQTTFDVTLAVEEEVVVSPSNHDVMKIRVPRIALSKIFEIIDRFNVRSDVSFKEGRRGEDVACEWRLPE